jgi:hypothetical protein
VAEELQRRYRIGHATIQVECCEDDRCKLAPEDVV